MVPSLTRLTITRSNRDARHSAAGARARIVAGEVISRSSDTAAWIREIASNRASKRCRRRSSAMSCSSQQLIAVAVGPPSALSSAISPRSSAGIGGPRRDRPAAPAAPAPPPWRVTGAGAAPGRVAPPAPLAPVLIALASGQARAQEARHRVGAAGRAELAQDVLDVVLDGALAHHQCVGDRPLVAPCASSRRTSSSRGVSDSTRRSSASAPGRPGANAAASESRLSRSLIHCAAARSSAWCSARVWRTTARSNTPARPAV